MPITNNDSLKTLKNELLPSLTCIYSKGLTLSKDAEEIAGKQKTVYTQYLSLLNQLPEVIDDEQQQFQDLNYQFLLEYVEQAKQYGIDVSEMEARLQRIAEKKQRIAEKNKKIEEDKKKIVELDKQLEEEKASLREKFKPLDTDDEGILWAKGSTFLADKMPEEAAECFQMFTDKTAAEYRLCGQNAVRFAKTYNRLAEMESPAV